MPGPEPSDAQPIKAITSNESEAGLLHCLISLSIHVLCNTEMTEIYDFCWKYTMFPMFCSLIFDQKIAGFFPLMLASFGCFFFS